MYSRWCFTEYTDPDDKYYYFKEQSLHKDIKYLVYQLELCPDTGRQHIQGYVQLKRTQRMSWLKSNISNTAHFEPQSDRSTNEEAREYCMKDDTQILPPVEIGSFIKGRGSRMDIHTVRRMLDDGASMETICRLGTSYQSMRMAELYHKYCIKPNVDYKPKEVYWFYGPTGSGKTKAAFAMVPKDKAVWETVFDFPQWFDGYSGEEYVIADEFRSGCSPLWKILKLLDWRELKVPIKGGYTLWKPRVVIITSPWTPQQTYSSEGEEMNQLLRRITEIREFK